MFGISCLEGKFDLIESYFFFNIHCGTRVGFWFSSLFWFWFSSLCCLYLVYLVWVVFGICYFWLELWLESSLDLGCLSGLWVTETNPFLTHLTRTQLQRAPAMNVSFTNISGITHVNTILYFFIYLSFPHVELDPPSTFGSAGRSSSKSNYYNGSFTNASGIAHANMIYAFD
jgi:hypothetical protein